MFKPYKEIEKTEEFTVYEFRTAYLWILYLLVGITALGYFEDSMALAVVGIVSMILYFALVSTQYIGLGRKIKRATKEGSVEITGSKWSFQKPLRVKIPNKYT